MLFNSIHFIFFLLLVFALYWLLPNKYRWLLLLVASYYFYASWSVWFVLLLLILTLIAYFSALKINQSPSTEIKKRWLWLAITCIVGSLLVFKYLGFFYELSSSLINVKDGFIVSKLKMVIVPIGLSFYSFRLFGYVMDVYREKIQVEIHLGKFALFASFFPLILSGPVERFSALAPQLDSEHKLNINTLSAAVRIGIWGFFKKIVIADRLAEFVDPVFNAPQHFSGLTLLIAAFFFVVQLYADFSGYTDIVTGVALLFGIQLSLNWRRPLLATSLVSFWKRYHITLTSWFHDYLYMSIVSNSRSYLFWLVNIFLVFVISGLWHGANLTFVVWGAMHGIVYLTEVILSKKIKLPSSFALLGWICVLPFHTLSLIAFRANSIADLLIIYQKTFSFNFNFNQSIHELVGLTSLFPLAVAVLLIVFLFMKELNEETLFLNKYKRITAVAKPLFYVCVAVSIFVLGKFNASEFIYSHF